MSSMFYATFAASLLFHIVFVDAAVVVYRVEDGEKEEVKNYADETLHYAPLHLDPIEGLIVLANPPDACKPLKVPQFPINSSLANFVLVNGSENCSYHTKIDNAARADFDVVVLFGGSSSLTSVRNTSNGMDISMPGAVVISYRDGLEIRENFLYGNWSSSVFYILEIGENVQDLRYYIILFSTVIGVCFTIIIIFMICLLVKYIQEKRRGQRNRLTSRQIKQLPTERYTEGSHYEVCAICLEEYEEGDKLRILPCSHEYHARCIDPWLKDNRRNCPLCKRKIRFGDTSSDTSSDSELSSPTENTPLVGATGGRRPSWGTFSAESSGGHPQEEQERPGGEGTSASAVTVHVDDTSDADNITTLPSTEGSVNSGYEVDSCTDLSPKLV